MSNKDEDRIAWLESLCVGDQVIIRRHNSQSLVRVSRITPKQIVIGGYSRFWKRNGEQVGASVWNSATLYPATEEAVRNVREKIERQKLINKVCVFRWEHLSVEHLRKVAALIDDFRKERDNG